MRYPIRSHVRNRFTGQVGEIIEVRGDDRVVNFEDGRNRTFHVRVLDENFVPKPKWEPVETPEWSRVRHLNAA